MKLSKHKFNIVGAYEKGYRVINNVVYRPDQTPVKGVYVKATHGEFYHNFSINKNEKVKTHCLVAYEKFGEDYLKAECVRHLDGNSLNNNHDNIMIGSHKENSLDRTPESRMEHALNASKYIRRLKTDQEIKDFLSDRATGMTYSQLGEKWNMGKSTISCMLKKADYIQEFCEKNNISFPVN